METKAETRIPAIVTPKIIAGKAYRGLISNRMATTEPVQAPVTGKGMATNSVRPMAPHRMAFSPRL